ncbi:hypothetical protein DICPUDRAFT_75700 [Dictyostelium purpureum]|uniref:Uncharacterized protein n=1 Tax=Dictyostelium purpureum TaxID=5786 RepID=F0ZBF2_DICPU|nr:uncharacterized protein DICPUDRAFT_75700 [Dictyostelium purpureum]EGC38763.1 hypothetical protein DICPUDRAFT_75700 [Dictyostelium purpureum]|eukprot:XP_003284754.1 hypothetical protein DICPUDRAFT_75700 [Dictyostelium purpureum]
MNLKIKNLLLPSKGEQNILKILLLKNPFKRQPPEKFAFEGQQQIVLNETHLKDPYKGQTPEWLASQGEQTLVMALRIVFENKSKTIFQNTRRAITVVYDHFLYFVFDKCGKLKN